MLDAHIVIHFKWYALPADQSDISCTISRPMPLRRRCAKVSGHFDLLIYRANPTKTLKPIDSTTAQLIN